MFSKYDEIRARRARGDKGFTLIELLVVVVIIGVLIAIAIPVYLNYRKGANDKAAQSDVRNAIAVMEQCFADNTAYEFKWPTDGVIDNQTGTTSKSVTGEKCTQHIEASPGTKLTIAPKDTGYTIAGFNANGHEGATPGTFKTYNYDSTAGGSVTAS
jgi:type IV pilus assembly protein PilA